MTAEEFRTAYPIFGDPEQFPDARVDYWLSFAAVMTSSRRWKCSGLRDHAQGLLVAHYMTVCEQRDPVTGAVAAPAGAAGAKTSESQSADGVSYTDGYDASAYTGDGQLAGTWYGQQFLDLRRLVGAGGMQL